MNLDPFGHVASARHFLQAARKRLAEARTAEVKKLWGVHIEGIEARIKEMEQAEMEFWNWMTCI